MHRHRSDLAAPSRRTRASRRCRPDLLALEGRALLATITVTSAADAGAGTLRQAVADSASGGTIGFAPALNGSTITLTSGPIAIARDLTIQGPGASSLTLSGGGKVGLFAIAPTNATATTPALNVTIDGLSLDNARSTTGGGAINATQANLTVDRDFFVGDTTTMQGGAVAIGAGFYSNADGTSTTVAGSLSSTLTVFRADGATQGGGAVFTQRTPDTFVGDTFDANTGAAINSGGTLTVMASRFTGNINNSTGFSLGGAIATGGSSTIAGSYFQGNMVIGSSIVKGGAIYGNFDSNLTVSGSIFLGNQARTTSNEADGGAIAADPGSSLSVSSSTFNGNIVTGGTANGGAVQVDGPSDFSPAPPSTTIANSMFLNNQAIGNSGVSAGYPGGNAFGGGVTVSTPLTITGTTFLVNQAIGGAGGGIQSGGIASGGGVASYSAATTVSGSYFAGNSARAGAGGAGIFGTGGGLFNLSGSATQAPSISNSQFVGNLAVGGDATAAGADGGFSEGGGIDLVGTQGLSAAPAVLTNVLLTGNSAVGGAGTPFGPKGGGLGGAANGGGVSAQTIPLTITGGQIAGNSARGGRSVGGTAGTAQGGGVAQLGITSIGTPASPLTITGVAVTGNMALGGFGMVGGAGDGGGVWSDGVFSIDGSTVAGNFADGGTAGGQGFGGGLFSTPTAPKPTIGPKAMVVGNRASTAGNDTYPS